jgi:site-specific recombinase XerD
MSDPVSASTNLTKRGSTYQFVLRVPKDVIDEIGKPRIQFSLGTGDEFEARRLALPEAEKWGKRFAEIRARKGLVAERPVAGALDTTGWTWPAWEALAAWVEASLLEDDLQARLKLSTGDGLVDPARMARRGLEWLARAKGYAETLRDYTLDDYAEQRLMWLQGVLGLLGVRLQKGTAYFERFLAACLAAEIRSTDQMILREIKRQGFGHTHPDAVQGPWRRAAPAHAEAPAIPIIVPSKAAPAAAQPASGHTLADCLVKWKERRVIEKKPIDPHLTSDMENTFARFLEHAKIDDIGQITRKMVVNFRDDFAKQENYTAGTINKKIGYILNMSKVAAGAGWIDQDLGRGYYLNAAGDEDQREPYTGEQLKTIFGHKLFTDGWRPKSVKALGEFGFWFPLISATHGMITSEVLQLGPDTVGPHPDAKDVMVFTVTTAGGRKVKTLARKRAVPIRQELLDMGFMDVVDAARRAGAKTLWPAAEKVAMKGATLPSNYFSYFWTQFARKIGVEGENQSLYSFRHSFQDRVKGSEWHHLVKPLMGHADGGMTDRYGAKKGVRASPIYDLHEAIQRLGWPWLKEIRPGLYES